MDLPLVHNHPKYWEPLISLNPLFHASLFGVLLKTLGALQTINCLWTLFRWLLQICHLRRQRYTSTLGYDPKVSSLELHGEWSLHLLLFAMLELFSFILSSDELIHLTREEEKASQWMLQYLSSPWFAFQILSAHEHYLWPTFQSWASLITNLLLFFSAFFLISPQSSSSSQTNHNVSLYSVAMIAIRLLKTYQ